MSFSMKNDATFYGGSGTWLLTQMGHGYCPLASAAILRLIANLSERRCCTGPIITVTYAKAYFVMKWATANNGIKILTYMVLINCSDSFRLSLLPCHSHNFFKANIVNRFEFWHQSIYEATKSMDFFKFM